MGLMAAESDSSAQERFHTQKILLELDRDGGHTRVCAVQNSLS